MDEIQIIGEFAFVAPALHGVMEMTKTEKDDNARKHSDRGTARGILRERKSEES
jgi:hypothetical protein